MVNPSLRAAIQAHHDTKYGSDPTTGASVISPPDQALYDAAEVVYRKLDAAEGASVDTQAQLLSEIEDFLSTRDTAEATFGRRAVNDVKFVGRLRARESMTLATINRVRSHIKKQSAAVQPQAGEPDLGADWLPIAANS